MPSTKQIWYNHITDVSNLFQTALVDSVAFNDTAVGDNSAGVTPLFFSNFAGSDYTDNGKWTLSEGTGAYLGIFTTVLDADVPGGRGLNLIGGNGNTFRNVVNITTPPATLTVGNSITWRWYHKVVEGDVGDFNYHPQGFGHNLGSPPSFALLTYALGGGGTSQPQLNFPTGVTGKPWATNAQVITHNNWYRYELTWLYISTNTWNIKFRIYNLAGTLIADETTFLSDFGNPSGTQLGALTYTNSNIAMASKWNGFSNGLSGVSGASHEQDRWAGIAAGAGDLVNIPYGYFEGEI